MGESEEEFEETFNIIANIMIIDGPDGHCDGAAIIAEYTIAKKNGKDKEWLEDHPQYKD